MIFEFVLWSFGWIVQSTAEHTVCQSNEDFCGDREGECLLYVGESSKGGGLGLFAGRDFLPNTYLNLSELMIPIIDANKNEPSLWHNHVWNTAMADEVSFEGRFRVDLFVPGLGMQLTCDELWENVEFTAGEVDTTGVHRAKDPTAGSFAYRHNFQLYTITHIKAGDEIFVACGELRESAQRPRPDPVNFQGTDDDFVCLSNLKSGLSTIPGAGRGAFATAHFQKGQKITASPLMHLEKQSMIMYEQRFQTLWHPNRKQKIHTNITKGKQLLLNYCFGHPDSNMLLLPFGSQVNFINHNSTPNIRIQWSEELSRTDMFRVDPSLLMLEGRELFWIDYIALRDIQPGEEIFLDYGPEWQRAFRTHTEAWTPQDETYISADDLYRINNMQLPIRTLDEQKIDPYPPNIQTACYYTVNEQDFKHMEDNSNFFVVEWDKEKHGDDCLRPCEITGRQQESDDHHFSFVARMLPIHNELVPSHCVLDGTHIVLDIPSKAILFVDKTFTSDLHLSNAFRHFIQVPSGFYPDEWIERSVSLPGTFLERPLGPFELAQIYWGDTAKPVSNNLYEIGLTENFTSTLLSYFERVGIVREFHRILLHGNSLRPGKHVITRFGGHNWAIERGEQRETDMHMILPADLLTLTELLRVLSQAGFDKVLNIVGTHFGLTHLTTSRLTLTATSLTSLTYPENVFENNDVIPFKISIPLILADVTAPEVDIFDEDDSDLQGGYKYRYHTATVIGQKIEYADGICNYRKDGAIRMVLNVYVAQLPENEVSSSTNERHKQLPQHWHVDLLDQKLPQPPLQLDEHTSVLEPGDIKQLTWENHAHITQAFQVNLAPEITEALNEHFLKSMQMQEYLAAALILNDPYDLGDGEEISRRGYRWFFERPSAPTDSNIHTFDPANKRTLDNVLKVLGDSGFDDVLTRVGHELSLESLTLLQITFVGVSYSSERWMEFSVEPGVYDIVFPLWARVNSASYIDFPLLAGTDRFGRYHIKENTGVLLAGSSGMMSPCDYRYHQEMVIYAKLRVAEISASNLESIERVLTDIYPFEEIESIMETRHWKKHDSLVRLPRRTFQGDFVADALKPGEIAPVKWIGSGRNVADFAFRVGVPNKVVEELLAFCKRLGIIKIFEDLLLNNNHLPPGESRKILFDEKEWYIQRPQSHWRSNMHWLSPLNEESQLDYLKVLGRGDFDLLLDSIGKYFEMEGLVAYHVTFLGVSECEKGFIHSDFDSTDGKTFNLIIPLILANSTGPELELYGARNEVGNYKYKTGEASMVGDDALHATSAVNYTTNKEMRVVATVYVADVNHENVEAIMDGYTQAYPPKGDHGFLLSLAGSHWRKDSDRYRLPR